MTTSPTTNPETWPRLTGAPIGAGTPPSPPTILGVSKINYVQPVCPPIQIWAWDDAPDEYRALSTHGGDEDWVAFLPDEWGDEYPSWMDEGTRFAVCDLYRYKVENGWIYIGAHA
jgi:hypothetical protein